MKKRCAFGVMFCSRYILEIQQRLQRTAGKPAGNVTKLLNSVHTLFTPDDSLAPCQRREIRNVAKNRQEKF